MKFSYQWLTEILPGLKKIPAVKLADQMTMSGLEVEEITELTGDVIFTVGVTPNRGDVLGHWGLARDIAVMTGLKFSYETKVRLDAKAKASLILKVKNPKACPRYTGSQIFNVKVGPSPAAWAERLESLGVRSINNIVDATNIIMLLTGHPVHAFDAALLQKQEIYIDSLKLRTQFKTLDGVDHELQPGDLVIADARGPVALAGIMGGENSEVSEKTADIILEVAFFDPQTIRRTARRLGLQTESSYRFERFVNPDTVRVAHQLLQKLILELAGGESGPIQDFYPKSFLAQTVSLPTSEIKRILGIEVAPKEVIRIFSGLGCVVKQKSEIYEVKPPIARSDLRNSYDLIEEIARIYGLEKIPTVTPRLVLRSSREPKTSLKEGEIKNYFVSQGFFETIHYSFGEEVIFNKFFSQQKPLLKLHNPISEEMAVMRPSLLPQLLQTFKANHLKVENGLKLFELRNVYEQGKKGEAIEKKILAGIYGGMLWSRNRFGLKRTLDFFDGKGILDNFFSRARIATDTKKTTQEIYHPGQSFCYEVQGRVLCEFGTLHPEILALIKWKGSPLCYFECDYDFLISLYEAKPLQFQPVNALPPVYRDLAVLAAKEIRHEQILAIIDQEKPRQLKKIELFDFYEGENIPNNMKSLAYSFVYEPDEESLTDEEVNKMHFALVEKLKKKLGVELR